MTFLTALLEGLSAAGVEFVVIGGVAAGAHGSTRVTFDLDVCYAPTSENRKRLAKVLRGWKAYLRGVEPGLPFEMDERALATSRVLTLTTTLGDLDVMDEVAGIGGYEAVLAQSVLVEAGGTRFRVLDLPGLLVAKRATRRPRDIAQIPELEALLARRNELRKGG